MAEPGCLTVAVALAPCPPSFRDRGTPHAQALAIVAVLTAMAVVVLDAAMVNVAVPSIAQRLAVAPAHAMRVVTVYQTAIITALLPCAALGERFGSRRIFLAGVALFAAAATLGSIGRSLEQLMAARFLQGLGGAAIMALGIAFLRQTLPAERMGAAIGWNALTVALCSAAGPSLGAMMISTAGWQSLFLIHLPLAAVALGAGFHVRGAANGSTQLDPLSMVVSAAGFASLMFGAAAIAKHPVVAISLTLASGILFWVLFAREKPKQSPLLPIDLLRIRAFRLSVLASVCCFIGQAAGMLAVPFHLQQGLGQTPLMTGVYMTSWPLAVSIAALASGWLADRSSAAVLCSVGASLIAAGLVCAAILPVEAGPVWFSATIIPCGLGFGIFQVPNNRTMFLAAPFARSAAAGGMQGTARLTGQTFGSVLVSILFAWTPTGIAPILAMAAGAAFALLAAAASVMQISSAHLEHGRRPADPHNARFPPIPAGGASGGLRLKADI